MYFISLHGMSVSKDQGLSWANTSTADSPYDNSWTSGIYATDSRIMMLSRDAFLISTENGKTWTPIQIPDTNTSSSIRKIYGSGDSVYGLSSSPKLFISKDGGINWTQKTLPLPLSDINSLAASGSAMVLATRQGPMISIDEGTTWTPPVNVGSIADAFINDSNIYLASGDKGIILSTNGGASFDIIPISTIGSIPIPTCITASGDLIFLGTDEGVFVLDNKTRTLSRLLSNVQANDIAFESNKLYVSTTKGLFISSDEGKSWGLVTTSNGLPDPYVFQVYVVGSTVYVATKAGISVSASPL